MIALTFRKIPAAELFASIDVERVTERTVHALGRVVTVFGRVAGHEVQIEHSAELGACVYRNVHGIFEFAGRVEVVS